MLTLFNTITYRHLPCIHTLTIVLLLANTCGLMRDLQHFILEGSAELGNDERVVYSFYGDPVCPQPINILGVIGTS